MIWEVMGVDRCGHGHNKSGCTLKSYCNNSENTTTTQFRLSLHSQSFPSNIIIHSIIVIVEIK